MWNARWLVLGALLACESTAPHNSPPRASVTVSAEAVPSSQPVDLSAQQAAFKFRLTRANEVVVAASEKERRCDDQVKGKVHAWAWAFANHVAKGTPLDATTKMTAFRPPSHQLLEVGAIALDEASARRLQHIFDQGVVAIVKPNKLVMPSVDDDKSFLTGELEGWVYVVDLAKGSLECAAPLAFVSSETVQWSESLTPDQAAQAFDIDKSDAAFHVRVDFYMQGQQALARLLKRIGPGLELETR